MGEARENKEACKCPYCDADTEVREQAPFCVPCDLTINECAHCGEPVRDGEEICPHCGESPV